MFIREIIQYLACNEEYVFSTSDVYKTIHGLVKKSVMSMFIF